MGKMFLRVSLWAVCLHYDLSMTGKAGHPGAIIKAWIRRTKKGEGNGLVHEKAGTLTAHDHLLFFFHAKKKFSSIAGCIE
jgi:hypothetical protein